MFHDSFRVPGLEPWLSISANLGLGNAINAVMLGTYSRFTGNISVDVKTEAFAEMAPAKQEANLEAVRQGFDRLDRREKADKP